MDLRLIKLDGQPWFVVGDVLKALCINRCGTNLMHLSPDESRVLKKKCGLATSLFPGRTSHIALVSESSLYKLGMRSDKPEAKAFQDWVTRVVLPAIRKDGAYVLGEEIIATGTSIPPKRGMLPRRPKHSAVSASTGAAPASWRATSPAPKTFVCTATSYHGQSAQIPEIPVI